MRHPRGRGGTDLVALLRGPHPGARSSRSRGTCATTRCKPACSSPLTLRRPSRKSDDALAVRKRTIDFAIRSQGMDDATLRQTFLPGVLTWLLSTSIALISRATSSRPTAIAMSHTSYLFISFGDDPASGRAWLGDQLPKVTTAVRWTGRRPKSTFNVAVTSMGLSALGVSPTVVESFSDEFQQGMSARASELGDVAPKCSVRLGGGSWHRPGAPARHHQRAR